MAKVTIKDVAREAGVSISTVSNALNGVDVLHPDTKAHILEVAERMNYIPNLNGRSLKSKQTKVIGFFLTSVEGPYYGAIVNAIHKECNRNGYELVIYVTQNDKSALSNILGHRIDGAIILNDLIKDSQVALLDEYEVPVIFLDRELKKDKIGSVIFDSYAGGKMMTQYLIDRGNKRIGYIHGYRHTYDDRERFRGFCDAMKEAGLEVREELLLDGYFQERSTYYAVRKFLKKKPVEVDAFFAGNDNSAIGCINALNREGYQVPGDVSVVGFDDVDICKFFSVPVTTVRNPMYQQGVLAVDRLIALIKGESAGSISKLKGSLVERASVK